LIVIVTFCGRFFYGNITAARYPLTDGGVQRIRLGRDGLAYRNILIHT
jgi:hypothetical protein